MLLDTYLDNFFGMTEMKIPKTLSHPGSGWALGFRSENKWIKTFNGLIKYNGQKNFVLPRISNISMFIERLKGYTK